MAYDVETPAEAEIDLGDLEAELDLDLELSDEDIQFLLEGSLTEGAEISEFEISKVMRGIRRRAREVSRLEDYKKQLLKAVDAKVGGKLRALEGQVEMRRAFIAAWLKKKGEKNVSFPDIGSISVTTKKSYEYEEETILEWLKDSGKSEYIKTKESLDKTAFKKYAESVKSGVPGFKVTEESSTMFREAK